MLYQSTGLKRSCLDKYYTKADVVKQVMDTFKKVISFDRNDVFIEPSAGSGAFIPHLKYLSKRVYFFDIMPEHKNIVQQDYMTLDTRPFMHKTTQIHVIGNPPFGRQSTLAKQFIAKSTEFADTIAFILPRSFKKTSMQSVFPLNWHLKHQHDLKFNAFTVNNDDLDVPSVFQIWCRDDTRKRRVPKKLTSVGFSFVAKSDSPDFAVRRIGFYAGKVDSSVFDKNEESHVFVKANKRKDVKRIQNAFQRLSFKHHNTVGPKSVSKQEILQKLPKEFKTTLS